MGEVQCNTTLGLSIGGGEFMISTQSRKKPRVQLHLSFPPWMKEEEEEEEGKISTKEHQHHHHHHHHHQHAERSPRPQKTGEEEGGARKKLRLTKEQSTLLEDSFRAHSTLNQNQKHELAVRLNLLPRQVEVWFQNRRARTKLKQTEVDYEFLKKCCERLSDENRRLKKELQELRSAPPLYLQLSKPTELRMCPSCEAMSTDDDDKSSGRIASPDHTQVLHLCH